MTQFPPSLWAEVTPPRSPAPRLTGEREAEAVVIGAGFTGLSAALDLAKAGLAPVVLEANAVGWGASGRNNGQVIPTLTAVEPDALVARYGEAGERFARLIAGSAGALFALARDEGIEAEAEQTGWFQPAHSPGRLALSARRVEAWRRFGAAPEILDARAAARLLGTDFWHGGMLDPTGGHVNPLALARGLAATAERHGAVIHEQSPATSFARNAGRWHVTTAGGTVTARALILATNAYTAEAAPGLAPRLARSLVPVLSWQMATEPLGDNLRGAVLPGRQAVSDTRGDLRFFRYDARNRLVTGGAILGARNAPDRARALARRRLAEAYPQLGGTRITHVWSGYVGMTADRMPHLHRLGPDAYAWAGCNGRGVALAVALGREIAAAVAGGRALALPLSEIGPLPFHPLVRRIAPAYLAWLKRRDRSELRPD